MKTIEIGIKQARLAQEAFNDNWFFNGMKQVFSNVYTLPEFESQDDELDYIDEIEMFLAGWEVTEYNIY